MKHIVTQKGKDGAVINAAKRVRKDGVIRARVEGSLKESVETVLERIGLTPSQAITLFYKQIEMNQGLPFEVKIPNAETLKALEDSSLKRNLSHYKSPEDMFERLKG